MNRGKTVDDLIDWAQYEKLTLPEKWAYLNCLVQDIDQKVRKIRAHKL